MSSTKNLHFFIIQSFIGPRSDLRVQVSLTDVVSSEGALYVILPYDYPQRSTHFLNTHRSLITTLSIDAVMTLLTVIYMKTKITKMTISDDNF